MPVRSRIPRRRRCPLVAGAGARRRRRTSGRRRGTARPTWRRGDRRTPSCGSDRRRQARCSVTGRCVSGLRVTVACVTTASSNVRSQTRSARGVFDHVETGCGGDRLRRSGRVARELLVQFDAECVVDIVRHFVRVIGALVRRAVGRQLDAELRRARHPRPIQQGRHHQGRAKRRKERARARARHLGGRRLLRPPRQVDRLEGQRLAGVVGRAAGEPPRGPVGAGPVQAAQGHERAAVRLLPRLSEGQEHQPSLPTRLGLDRPVREGVGHERGGRGPACGDRRG